MGGLLILIASAVVGYAWRTDRLRGYGYEDGIAVLLFLLGFRLLTTGRMLIGAALIAWALLWAAYRRAQTSPRPTMPVEDARQLLGVGRHATLAEISDAHRRLIARVHPDLGGSAELARRVNVARDILIAEINRDRRTRSAS